MSTKTFTDLTGYTFGRLTVIGQDGKNKEGRRMWKCKCECGNYKSVLEKCLKNGHTKSCGCYNKKRTSEVSLKDLTGMTFGKLTVEHRVDDYVSPSGRHLVKWNCKCSCGNVVDVTACQLNTGKTLSCGCLKIEKITEIATKHGGRHDRLYKVFHNMINRCYNSNSTDYKYYGGRGIQICDEWRYDYAAFKKWAYENGYDDTAAFGKCTIDRIDVNKNYSPDNCRWVDMKIQSQNRRNVINKNNDKCS